MPVVNRARKAMVEEEDPLLALPNEDVSAVSEVTAPGVVSAGGDVSIPTPQGDPVPVDLTPPDYPVIGDPSEGTIDPGMPPTPDPLPPIEPGPVPSVEEETPPIVAPPSVVAPPSSATFGRGRNVNPALRTRSFGTNRVVGGGVEDAFMSGFQNRFGPGVPVVGSPLPSGGAGDDQGGGALSDEELRRAIMTGRGRR